MGNIERHHHPQQRGRGHGILTFSLDFKYDDSGFQSGGMCSLENAENPGVGLVKLIDTMLSHFKAENITELKNLSCFVRVGVLGEDTGKITGFRSFGQKEWIMFHDIFR